DRVDDEVEAAGAIGHAFGDAVTQFAELMQEDGAGEGVAGFPLLPRAARHVGLGRSTLYRELALMLAAPTRVAWRVLWNKRPPSPWKSRRPTRSPSAHRRARYSWK